MACPFCSDHTHVEHPECTCTEPCTQSKCPQWLDVFDHRTIPVPRFAAKENA